MTHSDLEIEKLRLEREKEREEAQRQRDNRFAEILETHLEANRIALEKVLTVLEEVKAMLPSNSQKNSTD